MSLFRLLATLLVGLVTAWIVVALQYLVASGPLGQLAVVSVLGGFVVIALVGLRLLL